MASVATGETFSKDGQRCHVFYDTMAKERRVECVEKGEGIQEIETEGGTAFTNEFGEQLVCRGVDDEVECFRKHGIDVEDRVLSYR